MRERFQIIRWAETSPPGSLAALLREAEDSGYKWMANFAPEWTRRAFLDEGEGLFVAVRNDAPMAMAVISKDELVGDPRTGRLRYVFVSHAARRQGVADALVQAALREGDRRWQRLTLHTDNPAAAALYRRHGFVVSGETTRITHQRTNPTQNENGA